MCWAHSVCMAEYSWFMLAVRAPAVAATCAAEACVACVWAWAWAPAGARVIRAPSEAAAAAIFRRRLSEADMVFSWVGD